LGENLVFKLAKFRRNAVIYRLTGGPSPENRINSDFFVKNFLTKAHLLQAWRGFRPEGLGGSEKVPLLSWTNNHDPKSHNEL
jgi:hypothetical protein